MYMNKVVICGVDTSALPLLKEAEKERLLKRVKQGDAVARDELINGNLRLVLSVVQRFALRGENPDDLFQVGCIGLIKSIDNFDITQNVRFSTYAVPMMIECRETEKRVFVETVGYIYNRVYEGICTLETVLPKRLRQAAQRGRSVLANRGKT